LLRGLDADPTGPLGESLVIDALLLGLFAVQHSVMARPAFKRWWTHVIPPDLERSTYVALASAALALLVWQWRPLGGEIWSLAGTPAALPLQALFWAGWLVLLVSTFLINHFELFGLRQSFAPLLGLGDAPPVFRTPGLYRHVRHPIYLGFLMAFWSAPVMTGSHLFFALMTTGYILVGIFLEERDLVHLFGARYAEYRRQVGMLLPRIRPAAQGPLEPTPAAGRKRSA
nr:isoprenylcysteine carboxylmethyltransferase family protein [Pseudomonadota bacterium]